ncbi:hypothetical protein [Neobacillus cucumis]|uniref:hypothetical protein n=1 Tax=Neobacillus cucumis TaxID=1740721 RepID=UPI0019636C90|nr:hypothetical protein [Neobacillus cucumis]MBM7656213.1 hypothetical protein [Neobacillus cucumis]
MSEEKERDLIGRKPDRKLSLEEKQKLLEEMHKNPVQYSYEGLKEIIDSQKDWDGL